MQFRQSVVRIVEEIGDACERVREVANLETAQELKELAEYYNWDDGMSIPNAIVNHPKCDLGVALTLFWLAEAQCWITDQTAPDEYNREWAEFCESITERIRSGHYHTGETS